MALPIPIVVDNFADYYSEQKKLEAKELKREAQARQAEFDLQAKGVAEHALVGTLATVPGAFSSPPMSPPDGLSRSRQNGTLSNKFWTGGPSVRWRDIYQEYIGRYIPFSIFVANFPQHWLTKECKMIY